MTKGVKIRGRCGVGVYGGLAGRVLLLRSQRAALALSIPARQVVRLWQALEKCARVRVGPWIKQDGIVDIPGCLLPGIEDHFLVGMVWMQRRHDPLDWIVEKHRAHANRHGELEMVRGAEEWLVLAHRLALVVENGPAAADPARIADRSALKQWTGFSLRLFLDLAPKAIRIGEMVLDLCWLPRWRGIGVMGFTSQG